MHIAALLLRTLLGVPLLLYVPGLLLDRAWLAAANPLNGIERHVNRIVPSVLLTGWIALLLAEIGWFDLWLLIGCVVSVAAALAFLIRRRDRPRRASRFGIVAGGYHAAPTASTVRGWIATHGFSYALLGITLIFAALVARPFEVVRGGLDAGVYANTGIAIVRTGAIVQYDPIMAEIGQRAAQGDINAQHLSGNLYGVQDPTRFTATRMRASGFLVTAGDMPLGRVVPQFFHLWPVWIAVFVAMLGPALGLVATGAAGTLGVVLLGLIGRRVGGASVGVLAAAFLALMTPQVWFSRMSTSEALAQALILAGLWAFTHFASATERRERIWWGVLVGAAFGQLVLTRIDSFLAIGPIVALLGYVAFTRRWHAGYGALLLSFGGLLIYAGLHVLLIARAYVIDTGIPTFQKSALLINTIWPLLSDEVRAYSIQRPNSYVGDWAQLGLELLLLSLPLLAGVLLWRWPRGLLWIEGRVVRWRRPLLNLLVIALGLSAGYAYLIRPGILTPAVLRAPFNSSNWLLIQGYIGAPIYPPYDQYPDKRVVAIGLANMVRLGWYLSPLGVVLGVIGALIFWRHVDRRTWLFATIATAFAVFYIVSLQGSSSQTYIYILRRYVPIVYPAFALGMAIALLAIKGSDRSDAPLRLVRGARWSVFALGTLGLLLFFVVTGRTTYAHVEYQGTLAQLAALRQHFGTDDVILVRGGGSRETPELVATPLTYIYGTQAIAVKGAQPAKYADAVADQITRWRAEGRNVYALLAASGGDLLFPGYALQPVATWTLEQREFQQLELQKPKLSYASELPFALYRIVPEAEVVPPTALNYNDTGAQVAGFYPSEPPQADQPRAAWTNGLGVLRVPSIAQGRSITLSVAGGIRPSAAPTPSLCIDVVPEPSPHPERALSLTEPVTLDNGTQLQPLPWQELRCTTIGQQLSAITLPLPPLQTDQPLLIRLRSPAWTPRDTPPDAGQPASADRRQLGVQFVQLQIAP